MLAFFCTPFPEAGVLSTRPNQSIVIALLICLALTACGVRDNATSGTERAPTSFARGTFQHFVLIVLENEDAATVERIPYMDSLGRRGAVLQSYFAVAHPSYPNYLALIAGRTFAPSDSDVTHDPVAYRATDFGDAQQLIDSPTIADRLEAKGLTWDAFAEDYPDTSAAPAACYFGRSSGHYSRKHVPFLSFKEFHSRPGLCAHVRNLKWFDKDSLAAYTFVTPNMVHDGHDAPIDSAVTWLRGFLAPILADSVAMRTTVIAVTFDESASTLSDRFRGSSANRVFTVLIGGPVMPSVNSASRYTHLSMLKTVEANFDLSPSLVPPGTEPITGVWRGIAR